MLKPSVQLRLGQQLTMTPQLQQAIRLLQLSTLELQAQIQETLEQNPMLETADDGVDDGDYDEEGYEAPAREGAEAGRETGAEDATPTGSEAEYERGAQDQEHIPEDLPVDTQWDDIYDIPAPHTGSAPDDGRDIFENQSGGEETLQEHLAWQLDLTTMSDVDRAIAAAIVDAIGEDGYLGEPIESIHASLADDLDVELDEVMAVLHLIQQLDPQGCGAADLRDCLGIQLDHLPPDTPWLAEARVLVRDFLELLGNRDYKQIMRKMKLDEGQLQQVIGLIQTLNPRPGEVVTASRAEYIVPDVFVRRHNGSWQVELNPDIAPRLRINQLYASLIKRADQSADNTYLKENLQEARWFIKSLQSRNETLLRVATAIVERQRGFLEYGDEAMKPLVLRDIAEQLDMHESTISRVTTQKYMHTPRGIYEFKYFFSSHVATADGGECSATAIRAMIRKLIEEENPAKPLSDSKLAAILVERGINVARRTVAKYREAMTIPPSNERKRLA
ncbi:MAG: RNA polymerase factor sigma-54 [Chromatiales bacterium]|nr:RNA polymerase factor sigma-54 [Chromatiales bacterium]